MKRKQSNASSTRDRKARQIDAHRLTSVRGGDAGLGIAVAVAGPSADIMTQQHNETLIEL
jgi:hypothetical protein